MNAVVYMLAIVLPLGAAPSADSEGLDPNQQRVKTFLEHFPPASEIPGAAIVYREDERRVRITQHCLVHIRDMHGSAGMSPVVERVTRAVQQDVRSILEYFMDDPDVQLREVYKEGVTRENEAAINRGEMAPTSIGLAGQRPGERSPKLPAPSDDEREGRRALTGNEVFRLSGVFPLHRQRGLKLNAAELKATNSAAMRSILDYRRKRPGKRFDTKRTRIISSTRESILLQLIAHNRDPIAFVVFGGAHDWAQQVALWNRKHPDDTFTLIEITPKAYYDYYVRGRLPRETTRAESTKRDRAAAKEASVTSEE
ncbi:hypothetical protein Pan216_10290 [Planctomycetes bacterium Pan216]|uniref:Uncharacterized protein n=1 Tax=Kolteria novifilia TaxID=2527975 RepID=A0A518AZQ5_9BACT|nr:hypothetical protein Pan216_10290 [Planctomycetes bacterium Pan216]